MARHAGGGTGEARARRRKSQEFLDIAEVALSGGLHDAAASNAVLAGIASADALCLGLLGRGSRGESHDEAVQLLKQVDERAANDLRRLLSIRFKSQYDHRPVRETEAEAAVRRARSLLERAHAG